MTKPPKHEPNFGSVPRKSVPTGRHGKHKDIVSQIISDLEALESGNALKIPLADLPDTKENVRSALNRVTRQRGMDVATSSDDLHLYIWRTDPK